MFSSAALTIALLVAAAVPPQSQQAASDWPHWRGGAYDSTATSTQPVFAGHFELKVRWRRTLGPGYSGVVIASGHAVTMFSDGKNDVLISLSSESGREEWRFALAETFPGRDGSTGGPVSTPAIDAGVVYALGPRGELVAVRLDDGRQLWRRNLVSDFNAEVPHWGFTTSPLVTGNVVVVLTGGAKDHAVTAMNKRTGEVVWQSGTDGASYQSPMLATINGRPQIVVGGDQMLYGLDPADGRVLWSGAHGGTGFYAKILNPVLIKGRLLLTSKPDQSTLFEPASDGTVNSSWTTRELKLNYATPVAHDGLVFGYSGAFLTCVDAETGTLKWRSRTPGDGFPILVDGHLVVATKQGQLAVAQATSTGFDPKATIALFSSLLWTPPSFAEGRIFARDSYAEIAAVDIVPSTMSTTDAAPAPAPGRIPSSRFAAWVDKTAKSADPGAAVKDFLASHKDFPVIEGDRFAHIVYSGTDGSDVLLRSDVLGTGGEIRLNRVGSTDLYYASLELEPDARVSYQFVKGLGDTVADAKNPLKATSQNFAGDVSMILMPKADRGLPAAGTATLRGRIVDLEFDSGTARDVHLTWGGKRKVHVYLPPSYETNRAARYPAIYVMYGEEMLTGGSLAAALDTEMGTTIRPAVVIFVESTSAYEYARTFRDAHARMMAGRLVPWIDTQFRTSARAEDRWLVGGDEAGFAAVEIALRFPSVFGHALAQSLFPLSNGDDELLGLIDRTPLSGQTFYVDWGRYDPRRTTDKLDVAGFSARVRERLTAKGYSVSGHAWNDGSTVQLWSDRAVRALKELMPNR